MPNAIYVIETKFINETPNLNLNSEKRKEVRTQVVKFAHHTFNYLRMIKRVVDVYAIILTDEEINIIGKINQ